jgi:hypothetical protein
VMRHRFLSGLAIATLGAGLSLVPLSVASAKSHKGGGALCTDLKHDASGNTTIGTSISAALEADNFSAAKQQMIKAINVGLKEANPTLKVLKSAPGNVQKAMKGLLKFDTQFKTDIEKATSLTGFEASITALVNGKGIKADVNIVTAYISAQCGAVLPTTTTTFVQP